MGTLNFRAIGYTDAAINYPLNQAGIEIVAENNGARVDQLPEAFCYAPNAAMKEWLEELGLVQQHGFQVRDPDGRWWSRARIRDAYSGVLQ